MASDVSSGYSLVWLGPQPATVLLEQIHRFCMVDLRRAEGTTKNNVYELNRFLKWFGKDPREATTEDIRSYLARFLQHAPGTYSNVLKALKVFYRDYLQRPNLVKSFKFPQRQFTLKTVPKKADLREFYTALDSDRARCLFLLLASSGRRIREVLDLTVKDIDFEQRVLRPNNGYSNRTKRTWFSFYNAEAERALRTYLENSGLAGKLFTVVKRIAQRWFYKAQRKSEIRIRPKDLRDWFCCEMGELGVPDRYIDAFCGRVPKSVLARHYTDYNPERLKRIYDKADLSILH